MSKIFEIDKRKSMTCKILRLLQEVLLQAARAICRFTTSKGGLHENYEIWFLEHFLVRGPGGEALFLMVEEFFDLKF